MPDKSNGFKRFIRVVVTTQDEATLLVVFSNPLVPEYAIQNKTKEAFGIVQAGVSMKPAKCLPNQDTGMPYAWQDRMAKERCLVITAANGA